jgi:ATP-dependent Clp protease ATP-binding subunit ClpC
MLEEQLYSRIVGHKDAIQRIAKAVCRSKSGLADSERPIASFLFAGTTGVGKTELAKCLAEIMFGKKDSMIRVDMSEYMEKHSVSKLIGAPPGYAGYDESGNNLCEKVRRNPYSLILFDEIEKADKEVLNIMLQILEDGILTDSTMRRVSFRNCIIIMTSNAGSENYGNSLGFCENVKKRNADAVIKSVRANFSPEFINRIDDIIVFSPFDKSELMEISKRELNRLKKRANEIGIELIFDTKVTEEIASTKETEKYGARPIRRRVTELIEDELALMIVNGSLHEGDKVRAEMKEGKISFSKCVTV